MISDDKHVAPMVRFMWLPNHYRHLAYAMIDAAMRLHPVTDQTQLEADIFELVADWHASDMAAADREPF